MGFEFVTQKTSTDCAIAALAMYCKRSYEEIVELLPEEARKHFDEGGDTEAITDVDVCEALGMEVYYVEPDKFDEARPAVLSVPSLNKPDVSHSVFWTGKALWDPNRGRQGKKVYPMKTLPRKINNILQESAR